MKKIVIISACIALVVPVIFGMAPQTIDEKLKFAAQSGDEQGFYQAMKQGANINLTLTGGDTLLHWAVAWGEPSVVKMLLEFGADPTIRNFNDQVPTDYVYLATKNAFAQKRPAIFRERQKQIMQLFEKYVRAATVDTSLVASIESLEASEKNTIV